jgi:GH24 family phage-related lysozyme (muramidase)
MPNMPSILSRWKARRATRLSLLADARKRFAARKTKLNLAAVKLRKRQVALADRVIARHQPAGQGVSARGVEMVARFEGFSPTIYNDGVGVRTIGYGTTSSDVSPLPTHMTEPEARALLVEKLNHKYLPPVAAALAHMNPTQNMIDAAVSFAYNLGVGAFEGSSGFGSLTRALRSGDKRAVADAFLLYDNPNDPAVHAGLAARRRAERDLFLR